jgi:hypothetical protein
MWKYNVPVLIGALALVGIVVAVIVLSHHGHNPGKVRLRGG